MLLCKGLVVLFSQTQKICLMQLITCNMCLEPVPDSDGRELTWIKNDDDDPSTTDNHDGHYDMFAVRFKSRTIAANFRIAFTLARQLMMLLVHSGTAAAPAPAVSTTTPSSPSARVKLQAQRTAQ